MVELWISAFEHGNKKLSYPNLKFKNQAKTKDNLEEYKREWFIPVIGVSKNREEVEDLALEKLALLRKITAGEVQKLKDSDPPSINSSITWYYSKRVNRRLTNLLGPGTTAHTARKIYGAISVALYNRGSQVSDLAFLTDALAHRDFQSTSSYTNVRVI
jgi:integrase